MKEVIKNAIDMWGIFWGVGMYMILFFLSLVYLIAVEKDKKKKYLFLGHVLAFFVIYFFPITAYIIMKYCVGDTVYWRMYWLLPITVMIAYMLTSMIFEAGKRWQKWLAALVVLVMLAMTGNTVYSPGNFSEAQNPYKLNQDILAVCDAIEADAKENGITEIGAIVPNALATGIRQYDAAIQMPYGRNAIRGEKVSKRAKKIYNIMNAAYLDVEQLMYYAAKGNYNYLVYYKNEMDPVITETGYEKVADVGNYYIYRLPQNAIAKTEWLITEYGEAEGNQQLFYTMQDQNNHVIVVDGGWVNNAGKVREVIADLGNHVDAWILTHPHEDHIGAFCEVYDKLGDITIDKVYAVDMASPELCMKNASWDSVAMYERFLAMDIPELEYMHTGDTISVGKLEIDVLSAYDDKVDELSNDLLNDGSMMFQVHGKSEVMLFCADVGKSMSKYLVETYGELLKSDYIQMGHHGNGGLKEAFYRLVSPKIAFFDAPDWLFYDKSGRYTTPQNRMLMASLGSEVVSFSTAPNSIILK